MSWKKELNIGFAIVYNASIINFAERRRELATLRVMGFTTREISGLLFKETQLLIWLGVALGLPFGRLMAEGYTRAVSTDLFTLPVVVYPLTYVFSALIGVFFAMVAHFLAVRGVKKIDLVETLRNKD